MEFNVKTTHKCRIINNKTNNWSYECVILFEWIYHKIFLLMISTTQIDATSRERTKARKASETAKQIIIWHGDILSGCVCILVFSSFLFFCLLKNNDISWLTGSLCNNLFIYLFIYYLYYTYLYLTTSVCKTFDWFTLKLIFNIYLIFFLKIFNL